MKLSSKLLIVAAAVVLAYCCQFALQSLARTRQYEWATVQSKRCSTLGTLLYAYKERYQLYPDSLHDLVDSGLVTETRYRELMFQEKPGAPPREWKYHKPTDLSSPALFSGRPVNVWNCQISTYFIGHADGSTIGFGKEKLAHLRRKLDASQLDE
jgi:hypothetical protein